MSDLAIGEADAGDLADILALMRHLNPDDPPLEPGTAGAIAGSLFSNELTQVLLGRHEGRAVTSCTLVTVPNLTRGGRPYALVENVVTDAEFRGRGFGRAIMQAAVERAEASGCYKVMLMTGRKDEAVLLFYESCGFDRSSKTAFQMRLAD